MKNIEPVPQRERIAIVEQLRGIAAFAVLWYHFTHANPRFLDGGFLKATGNYGWIGVQVFFVISGFVIPLAMFRANYRAVSHLPSFLVKRFLRVEPPYLVTVLLCVALNYLFFLLPGSQSAPPDHSTAELALHVGYFIGFSDYDWVNPVFWSLAIEFQFYIAMAILFPAIASERRWIRNTTLALLFLSYFMQVHQTLVLRYIGFFTLGMVTFHHSVGWLGRWPYLVLVSVMALAIGIVEFPGVGIACFGTALALAFIRGGGFKPLVGLGTISYSLYLLHSPIGGRVIDFGERIGATGTLRLAILFVAITVSIGVAYFFYLWVERPAHSWSARMRYGERPTVAVSPALSAAARSLSR